MCILIWIYSMAISVVPLLGIGINKYIPEGFLTTCSFDYLSKDVSSQIFVLTMFFTSYVIPLIIITCSYVAIVITMKHSSRQFTSDKQASTDNRRCHEASQKMEYELMKACLFLITLWTISWTPYAIVSLLGLFTDGSYITPETSMYPAVFAKVASLLDSYVYGLSHPGFKRQMISKLSYIGIWTRGGFRRHRHDITSARFKTYVKSDSNINTYHVSSVPV